MVQEVVVLHKGALAHYEVSDGAEGWFKARLLYYKGNDRDTPAPLVEFRKDGRHCTGNVKEQELMDDLYYAAGLSKEVIR